LNESNSSFASGSVPRWLSVKIGIEMSSSSIAAISCSSSAQAFETPPSSAASRGRSSAKAKAETVIDVPAFIPMRLAIPMG
jgi:hypothetical protein